MHLAPMLPSGCRRSTGARFSTQSGVGMVSQRREKPKRTCTASLFLSSQLTSIAPPAPPPLSRNTISAMQVLLPLNSPSSAEHGWSQPTRNSQKWGKRCRCMRSRATRSKDQPRIVDQAFLIRFFLQDPRNLSRELNCRHALTKASRRARKCRLKPVLEFAVTYQLLALVNQFAYKIEPASRGPDPVLKRPNHVENFPLFIRVDSNAQEKCAELLRIGRGPLRGKIATVNTVAALCASRRQQLIRSHSRITIETGHLVAETKFFHCMYSDEANARTAEP